MKRNIAVILMIVIFAVGCSSKSSEELIQEYTKNAEAFYEAEDYTGAAGWMNHAIDEAETKYGKTSVEVARLYLMKSQMAEYAIDALRDIQCAETIYKSLNDGEGMVRSNYYYGDYYLRMGDAAQAIEYYDKVIELGEALGDEINEWKYEAYFHKGLCEADERKSIEMFKEAEKFFAFIPLEKQNTKAITLYHNIGVRYCNLDMDEEAIKYFTKAIEGYEKEEKEIGTLVVCYELRSGCYINLENLEYAMEDAWKAKELFEENTPDMDIWDRAGVYFNIAMLYSFIDEPEHDKVLEYGLIACRMYEEEKEGLEVDDLEGFKVIKETFEILYDDTPYARQQDFETWYQENIDK